MVRIDTNNLYQILKDFHTLTKIRIVLIDGDFNEMISYPPEQKGFCSIIRKNIEINAKCVECDREACQRCAKNKELIKYQCHSGLTEVVVPIYDRDGVMGYAMFGQVLPNENLDAAKNALKKRYEGMRHLGVDDAVEQIPVKSSAELRAAATVLQALVAYALSKQWVTPGRGEFVRRIDQYIDENMSKSITVDDITALTNVSRTRLYELSDDFLGCGLAEYIRKRRIDYAKTLLETTGMPISDIAYATGFSDYTHFSRVFKKQCGISAREYKKRYREKAVADADEDAFGY